MTEERQALREALKHTAVALKQGEVPFALGGGYACWALGGPEPEHDADFVVAEQDRERAAGVLAEAGLQVEQPPEDWLFKVFRDGAMIDVVHRLAGVPVEPELLERAQQVEVLSVWMPVLTATDALTGKLLALSEKACDFGRVLPSARALREQVDWEQVGRQVEHNPYAAAFLELARRLRIVPA